MPVVKVVNQKGKKVFVHIGSPENAINAIKAGADVLAHGVWRGELSVEQASIQQEKPFVPSPQTFAGSHHKDAWLPQT